MRLSAIGSNVFRRNPARTALTVAGGGVTVFTFVFLRTVVSSWNVSIDYAAKDRLGTRHAISMMLPLPIHYVDIVRQVRGVRQVTHMTWFGGEDRRNPGESFGSMAVDGASFLDVYDEAVVSPDERARWLQERRGALVGDLVARRLGVKVGDRLTLSGTIFPGEWEFVVSGIYHSSRKSLDRSEVLFHWDYLNASLPEERRDHVGWIATRVDVPDHAAAVSAAIDQVLGEREAPTVTMSEGLVNASFLAGISAVVMAIDVACAVVFLIMALILGNTIAMGVRERTREYGVLRALGFSRRHTFSLVVGEGLILGVLGGVVGVFAAYPIVQLLVGRWVEENMGFLMPYFRIDAKSALLAPFLSGGLAALASLLPAYFASKLPVVDALRHVD